MLYDRKKDKSFYVHKCTKFVSLIAHAEKIDELSLKNLIGETYTVKIDPKIYPAKE